MHLSVRAWCLFLFLLCSAPLRCEGDEERISEPDMKVSTSATQDSDSIASRAGSGQKDTAVSSKRNAIGTSDAELELRLRLSDQKVALLANRMDVLDEHDDQVLQWMFLVTGVAMSFFALLAGGGLVVSFFKQAELKQRAEGLFEELKKKKIAIDEEHVKIQKSTEELLESTKKALATFVDLQVRKDRLEVGINHRIGGDQMYVDFRHLAAQDPASAVYFAESIVDLAGEIDDDLVLVAREFLEDIARSDE